ncbi:MAG TPA: malto-oligosyltrehalose synthase, partial [Dissulfurispiraceae bacterium]|nr:malto-oligosyltrehalose synthase [Dissulfurispiraceae bacterium]
METSGDKPVVPFPRIPIATYRLQFNRLFRFPDAKKIVRYLHDLGITDVYASPYLKARKGSLHGYDIVDPTLLNPELGSEHEYDEFMRELIRFGMGQILDIVPNHMCADSDNPWWMDVMENGPCASAAGFFDIDWNPAEERLRNRVLLPVLADQYGKVLERQELRLAFGDGAFSLHYDDLKLPLQPNTYISVLQHRLDILQKDAPPDAPHIVEFLSIVTALKHLPLPMETDKERIAERYREKEIIKKRLARLCAESPSIDDFIGENVHAFNGSKGDPGSFDLLDRLLDEQVWRLSFWRVASEEINYRRFFDINHIAAIHMEDENVFRETHKLILDFVAQGKISGLRVDHPDGLYNPEEYFKRLQRSCFVQRDVAVHDGAASIPSGGQSGDKTPREREYEEILSSTPQFKPFYIVGEKIITKGEKIPEGWPIFGTTGYVFLNSVNGIFVDSRNAKSFDKLYSRFARSNINFQDLVYEKKKLVMQVAMSGEISTLGHYLDNVSEKNRHTRDFTLYSLTRAIMEIIAFFPVYRSYINSPDVNEKDRQHIEYAVAKAKLKNPAMSTSIFDFLKDVLLLRFPDDLGDEDRKHRLDFVMKFQQFTGPVMAKGLEDTAFYIYNRLISLNEVGSSAERFGTTLEAFHGQNIERGKTWPHSLITTSTHDTKRGEDVRARINVLS